MDGTFSVAHGTLIHAVYVALLFFACFYAVKFGDKPEKIAAAIFFAASIFTGLVVSNEDSAFHSMESFVFVVDVLTWAGLCYIALTSNRFWPLWATSFQTIAIVTHLAVQVDQAIVPRAYAIGQGLWAYPILAALLVGSERCRRLRLRHPAIAARY